MLLPKPVLYSHCLFLAAGGQLLARSGQHWVRLLANQQSERLQHDQLRRWVCCWSAVGCFLKAGSEFWVRSSWLSVDDRAYCGAAAGLEMAWVQRPPDKVTNGEEFNVSYTVTASDSFYDYAVRNRIFQFGWVCYINTWNLQRRPCPENKYARMSEASSSNDTKWPVWQFHNNFNYNCSLFSRSKQGAKGWVQLEAQMNWLDRQGLFGLTLWGNFQSLVPVCFLVEMHLKRGASAKNTSAQQTGTAPMK